MGNRVAFNYVTEEMGMNRSKAKGTAVETALVDYLKDAGFPDARRKPLTGSLDQGDVDLTIHPTIIAECKYASGKTGVKLTEWMRELGKEVDNAKATFGILVAKQAGAGDQSIGRWVTACTISHYGLVSDVAPIIPRPVNLWKGASTGTAIPGAITNGQRGWVEQLINRGGAIPAPEQWGSDEVGSWIGWRCATSRAYSDDGISSIVVGPLWRFLRALRAAGYGEPLS